MLLYLDYVVIPPSPCMVQNGVFDHKHHYSKLWLGGARSSRAWQHFYYMPRYFEKGNFTPRKGWRIYIFLCNCGHILTRYVVIFMLCSYILTMQLCISSQCSYILSLKLSLVFHLYFISFTYNSITNWNAFQSLFLLLLLVAIL